MAYAHISGTAATGMLLLSEYRLIATGGRWIGMLLVTVSFSVSFMCEQLLTAMSSARHGMVPHPGGFAK